MNSDFMSTFKNYLWLMLKINKPILKLITSFFKSPFWTFQYLVIQKNLKNIDNHIIMLILSPNSFSYFNIL